MNSTLKLYHILFMFFIFNVAHGYYDCLFSQPPVNHWSSYQFVTVHLKITVLQCNVKAQKNWNKLVCSVFTLLYMFYLPLHKLCKKPAYSTAITALYYVHAQDAHMVTVLPVLRPEKPVSNTVPENVHVVYNGIQTREMNSFFVSYYLW